MANPDLFVHGGADDVPDGQQAEDDGREDGGGEGWVEVVVGVAGVYWYVSVCWVRNRCGARRRRC